QSAPAARTLSTSSPRRAKSADRMDGAMTVGCMVALVLDSSGRAAPVGAATAAIGGLLAPAQCLDAVVRGVDLTGAGIGLPAQFVGGAGELVGVVLGDQAAVREVDLGVAGLVGQPEHAPGVLARPAEPVHV